MPNQEHLTILEQGVEKWNEWLKNDVGIIPDLSGANLSRPYLTAEGLRGPNLHCGADLSGAIIYEHTIYYKIIGCKKGVNGIWSEDTDSAALMQLGVSLINIVSLLRVFANFNSRWVDPSMEKIGIYTGAGLCKFWRKDQNQRGIKR